MSSLKVAVRCRPFNQREIDMEASEIVEIDGKKTRLYKPRLSSIRDSDRRDNFHDFTFDYSYWSFNSNDENFATQEQVYNDLGTDVVECAFQGYNACVFAYGQTGSGKTYTMMGSPDNPGLIPRICQELFARMRIGHESGTGYKTHASYLEIYNERVKDLLGPQTTGHNLRVREHRSLGPYVENLSQHAVSDFDEIQECIGRGNTYRTTASTNMNDTSSRSHAIFTITFVQAIFMNDMPSETVSKIHLVDLAGSERANATGATGQRLKEGAHINKSLVTLGSVISALAEQTHRNGSNQKPVFYIPYRDSILTWLLKDSLGGNSKTIMIAAISPADCNYSETLSTLRYSNRAKNIINKPTVNEDPNVKLIRELRDEINKLKSMLTTGISKEPGSKILEDLLKKEAQEKVLTEEWTEKWKEAQSILQEQKTLGLRKAGAGGVTLDSEMPHLIGIHNDITTGVTLYSLKDGETTIGSDESEESHVKITLTGVGILLKHCSIVLKDGHATLIPYPQAQCWLNANLINEPTSISQGDIILLGRTNIFRFNNPAEAAKLRQKDINQSHLDISRLSLITASKENLLSSSGYGEDEIFGANANISTNSPFKRDKQYFPSTYHDHDDAEMQDENRKILDTIENALKQLNIERVQMHQQYKNKVKKLTEQLQYLQKEEKNVMEIIRCKEKELLARRDMIVWEKNNEKIQIDIVCRQISALQTQLDSKKRDFSEYVAKELQELQDCGKLDEIGLNLTENTSLTDELLLRVSDSLNPAASQIIRDTVRRNNDEIFRLDEHITEKERILNISTQRIAKLDEEVLKLNSKLAQLQENQKAIIAENLKDKKQSLKLNLKSSTDCNGENSNVETDLDTSDTTYHTANSDCSTYTSASTTPQAHLNSAAAQNDSLQTNVATTSPDINSTSYPASSTPCSALMSDSGVGLDAIRPQQNDDTPANGHPLMKISDDETGSCCSSCGQGSRKSSNGELDVLQQNHPNCRMHKLRRKIAIQKALIMKNLEREVNKNELDDEIAKLQELQKIYVKMEKQMQINNGQHSNCCLNDGNLTEEDEIEDENTNNGLSKNVKPYSSARSSIISGNHYAPSMTRSLPSMDSIHDIDQYLTVPSYIIRGAGKQTHYEFEIRIKLPDGNLNLLRRYSRFRELHLSMKNTYGAKIAMIPFPRRELFSSNSESVAKQRRHLLEQYLRRLLIACSKIPQSPIYEGQGGYGLTKQSIGLFSPFFRKGLFESGKHGTG